MKRWPATEKRREEFKQRIENSRLFRCELVIYKEQTFAICFRSSFEHGTGGYMGEHIIIYWVGYVGDQVIFDNTTNKQGFPHQHHIIKFYNQELSSEPTTATWD